MGIDNVDVDEGSPEEMLMTFRNELLNDINLWLIALEERQEDVKGAEAGVAEAQEKLVKFDKWAADHGVMLDAQILSEVK